MCGRYAITSTPQAMREFMGYLDTPDFPPRFNIAPTQPIPLVYLARDPDGVRRRRFLLARWGFVPGFVKDPKTFPLLINARAEGVEDKPSFRAAMQRRRCIAPADAYYEWMRGARGAPSRPYLFRRADGKPMGLAALYETWCGVDGSEIDTACILTTDACAATVGIHDRMPAVLEPEDFDAWLDCENVSAKEAARLVRPAEPHVLDFYEIGRDVNKVANDGAWIQRPVRDVTEPCLDLGSPPGRGAP